jgi:hypothetical protein
MRLLKARDRWERVEICLLLALLAGAAMLSIGIGLTILSPRGLPAILAMMGSLVGFLATTGLIFLWFFKELMGG